MTSLTRKKNDLAARLAKDGPRKMLAIDGGGIRGIISLKILERVEQILIEKSDNPQYRLADFFDYIAGTSTGGIIAAGLSLGMKVDDILSFYTDNGKDIFNKASIVRRLRYQFNSEPLAEKLREVFGETTTLGSGEIETLLLLVMRNATTDSPWPICNNPFAKYNDPRHPACNLNMHLWQLARASTAAPIYFPPETLVCGDKPFIFVDGGVTMYNNPAFQMFLMATVSNYWPLAPPEKRGWKTGVDEMLIVSVGTGTSAGENLSLTAEEMNILYNATNIPSALMSAALNEQDFLCRVFGQCVAGAPLDREIGDMIGSVGPFSNKAFRFVRYNADLTEAGLSRIGCSDLVPERVQRLDAVDSIDALERIGQQVAHNGVSESHFKFETFRPVEPSAQPN
ncbi:patatin-like phospholipase family protein [Bradyrhizobium sp. 215_C5_N1_1]|uniref:patatin-like phospholipase family protein n=1 Tax=unclassified Bradyrhizobium TaxID=2631580 RepID=UPI003F897567